MKQIFRHKFRKSRAAVQRGYIARLIFYGIIPFFIICGALAKPPDHIASVREEWARIVNVRIKTEIANQSLNISQIEDELRVSYQEATDIVSGNWTSITILKLLDLTNLLKRDPNWIAGFDVLREKLNNGSVANGLYRSYFSNDLQFYEIVNTAIFADTVDDGLQLSQDDGPQLGSLTKPKDILEAFGAWKKLVGQRLNWAISKAKSRYSNQIGAVRVILAESIGRSESTIIMIENGETSFPSRISGVKAASILGVESEWLLAHDYIQTFMSAEELANNWQTSSRLAGFQEVALFVYKNIPQIIAAKQKLIESQSADELRERGIIESIYEKWKSLVAEQMRLLIQMHNNMSTPALRIKQIDIFRWVGVPKSSVDGLLSGERPIPNLLAGSILAQKLKITEGRFLRYDFLQDNIQLSDLNKYAGFWAKHESFVEIVKTALSYPKLTLNLAAGTTPSSKKMLRPRIEDFPKPNNIFEIFAVWKDLVGARVRFQVARPRLRNGKPVVLRSEVFARRAEISLATFNQISNGRRAISSLQVGTDISASLNEARDVILGYDCIKLYLQPDDLAKYRDFFKREPGFGEIAADALGVSLRPDDRSNWQIQKRNIDPNNLRTLPMPESMAEAHATWRKLIGLRLKQRMFPALSPMNDPRTMLFTKVAVGGQVGLTAPSITHIWDGKMDYSTVKNGIKVAEYINADSEFLMGFDYINKYVLVFDSFVRSLYFRTRMGRGFQEFVEAAMSANKIDSKASDSKNSCRKLFSDRLTDE